MKRIIGFILACIFVLNMQAQKENYWSLKLDVNTQYYFFDEEKDLKQGLLAFAPSLMVSKYFNKWNIGFGFDYVLTKETLHGREDYLDALDFPLLVKYNFHQSNKTRLNVVSGVIFNMIGGYGGTLRVPDGRLSRHNMGFFGAFSLRLGLEYSQELSRILRLNIQPFVNWKFFDKNSAEERYNSMAKIGGSIFHENVSVPYDFVVGINLGFEFMFKKRKTD